MIVMEQWKDIPGYEGKYQVSDLGNVRSLDYKGMGICQLLQLSNQKHGYLVIKLTLNRIRKLFLVHQLVAMTFLGHKPNGHKIQIDHIDHNRHNNRLDNLRLVTARENMDNRLLKNKKSNLPKGVTKVSKKTYRVMITINGNRKYLGTFNTPEEASTAYQKELRNHG